MESDEGNVALEVEVLLQLLTTIQALASPSALQVVATVQSVAVVSPRMGKDGMDWGAALDGALEEELEDDIQKPW